MELDHTPTKLADTLLLAAIGSRATRGGGRSGGAGEIQDQPLAPRRNRRKLLCPAHRTTSAQQRLSLFRRGNGAPAAPPELAEAFGYGVFSARFGNLYTSRQLLQLLHRSYGLFKPADDFWRRADGRRIDPYRPQIQPDGFASMAEFIADREQHFAAVRRMLETMDVFVFTLGLTEGVDLPQGRRGLSALSGRAGGGRIRSERTSIRQSDRARDRGGYAPAFSFIRQHNRQVLFIVTVSPVPLIATAEDRSVLVSTTYSKAALRVACATWR